jgi:uncharacterized membrane protein
MVFSNESDYFDQNYNESDTFEDSEEAGNMMDLWLRIIWDTLFIVIICIATVGNLMVLWIIAGKSTPQRQSLL